MKLHLAWKLLEDFRQFFLNAPHVEKVIADETVGGAGTYEAWGYLGNYLMVERYIKGILDCLETIVNEAAPGYLGLMKERLRETIRATRADADAMRLYVGPAFGWFENVKFDTMFVRGRLCL